MKLEGILYRAIARSMVARYASYAVHFASLAVLARVFSPEVFGTIAAISVVFLFFQIVVEAGMAPAIVSLRRLRDADRDGIFGITILFSGGMALVLAALSPLLVAFYGMPDVGDAVPYIAASIFFFGAAVLPQALLLRQQKFGHIAAASAVGDVVGTVAAIGLALRFEPIHALAAKSTIASVTTCLLIHRFSAATEFGRPRFGTRFSAIMPLIRFAGFQFGFNLVNYATRNLDNILVGRYFGATSLGIYNQAYQLMRYPLLLLTSAMTPAVQPVLSQSDNTVGEIRQLHDQFVLKLSLVGAVAGYGLLLLSEPIVLILLGPQWVDVIPIIEIFAVAIPVQVVLSTSGSFFQSMERTDYLFLTGAISGVLVVTATVLGIRSGSLTTLAWYLVLSFHFCFIQTYIVLYALIFREGLFGFFVRLLPMTALIGGMLAISLR